MKKSLFLIAVLFGTIGAAAQEDKVLMTIDGQPVMTSEFMYIYEKNNRETAVEQKSMDEYLDLFINFKLKVHEAEMRGIDTTAAFIKELAGYRGQATPKYMRDESLVEEYMQKAYKDMQRDVRVAHIAIECPMNADAETEAAAVAKLEEARERLTVGLSYKKGKKTLHKPVEKFADVAAAISSDPSAKDNGGELGWIAPFRYVYPFEKAVFSTPVGQLTEIFRTPFGFHLALIEEERFHEDVHASHIMKMTPGGTDDVVAKAKVEIDSIYALLKNGADFAQTAMQLSDDKGSARQGGDLGWFGRGMMVKPFEDAVFALQDSGQMTEPFQSRFGWHIAILNGRRGVQPYDEIKEDLKKKVLRDERRNEIDNIFVARLKEEYHFAENTEALNAIKEMAGDMLMTDSIFKSNLQNAGDMVLFQFADQSATQKQFADFILQNSYTPYRGAHAVQERYDNFVDKTIRAYEDTQLEKKYPELRHLVTEYHDGILLFDVSLEEVWDKAATDTIGLTKFFEQNRANYPWTEPHYKGYVVYCKDKNIMKAAKNVIKKAPKDSINSYLRKYNTDSITYIRFEKNLWLKGQNAAVDMYGFKDKKVEYTPKENLPVVFTMGKVINAPEEYMDERGKVVSDYQDYLDKQWIATLREKYSVVVNQDVFNALKAGQK